MGRWESSRRMGVDSSSSGMVCMGAVGRPAQEGRRAAAAEGGESLVWKIKLTTGDHTEHCTRGWQALHAVRCIGHGGSRAANSQLTRPFHSSSYWRRWGCRSTVQQVVVDRVQRQSFAHISLLPDGSRAVGRKKARRPFLRRRIYRLRPRNGADYCTGCSGVEDGVDAWTRIWPAAAPYIAVFRIDEGAAA